MRAIKKNEQRKSINLLLLLISVILFIVILSYMFIWKEVKQHIVKILNTNNVYYEVSYDKIDVAGFPFIIKTTVNNLRVKVINKSYTLSINFDKLKIRNLIFTKNINLLVDGVITIKNNQNENYSKISIGNHTIDFDLDSEFKANNIDAFISNLIIKNYKDNINNLTNNLNNTTLKLITTNDIDYENKTIRINIDDIKTIFKDKDNILESNFEIIFSNIREYNNNNIVSMKNLVDTFVFNDISNNYSLNLEGNYNVNSYTRSGILDANVSIMNYNYLISAINNDSDFLFDKNLLLNGVQILELIPKNNKDTKTERHYNIKSDTNNKKFFINNVEINRLIQQLIFKNDIN